MKLIIFDDRMERMQELFMANAEVIGIEEWFNVPIV